jgi:uncharacterized protein (TIGR03435 family)
MTICPPCPTSPCYRLSDRTISALRAFALLAAVSAPILLAQVPAAAKDTAPPAATGPLIVDVHASPYRAKTYYTQNLGHQRFDMRDATILDLIEEAYERRDETVLGGPTWISFDRFDVTGKIDSLEPPKFSAPSPDAAITQRDPRDAIRPFLKRVLEERFHLKYHTEERPLPGYIMTVAKDGMKAPEAKDPSAPPNCRGEQDKTVPGGEILTCTSQTTAQLVKTLGGVYPHQLVDRTGLTKSYDITIHANFANIRTQDEYTRIFTDAFRQLGLIVTPGDVPQPALVVDSVERPTPNQPDIAKLIPPPLDLEFEVATIKPAEEDDKRLDQIRPTATEITFSNFSVQGLITRAFQFPTGAMISNRPPWLNVKRYTVLVKLPPDIDGRSLYQNQDEIAIMLQKLMADRFGLKYHWGEQKLDGWVLEGGTPKMKKADPNSRTLCAWGVPDGEKDVRSTPDSPYDNEVHCQNVTMAQFADVMQAYTGSDMKYRIFDKTGLAGSWDFTLYYSSAAKITAASAAADAKSKEAGADATSDPVGGMSLNDAIHKELGLQLVRQPGTYPALVLDHIEQTPTNN